MYIDALLSTILLVLPVLNSADRKHRSTEIWPFRDVNGYSGSGLMLNNDYANWKEQSGEEFKQTPPPVKRSPKLKKRYVALGEQNRYHPDEEEPEYIDFSMRDVSIDKAQNSVKDLINQIIAKIKELLRNFGIKV